MVDFEFDWPIDNSQSDLTFGVRSIQEAGYGKGKKGIICIPHLKSSTEPITECRIHHDTITYYKSDSTCNKRISS